MLTAFSLHYLYFATKFDRNATKIITFVKKVKETLEIVKGRTTLTTTVYGSNCETTFQIPFI
jgi:hypothetical protein